MRRRKKLTGRELAALGFKPHEPTEFSRGVVRSHAYNKAPNEIIARILRITVGELKYHYWEELELTEYEILGMAARNLLALANQTGDLAVALRANETLLRTRSAHWREPKAADPPADALPVTRVENMTLAQVEAELARIGYTPSSLRDAPAAESAPDPVGKVEPE